MSFTQETKDELAHLVPSSRRQAKAELAGILRPRKLAQAAQGEVSLSLDYAFLTRLTFRLFRLCFPSRPRLVGYTLHFDALAVPCLEELGIHGASRLSVGRLTSGTAAKKAYLRGVFLSCGTVSKPEKGYHMEMVIRPREVADEVCQALAALHLSPGIAERGGGQRLYFKEGDQIAAFLSTVGAFGAVMAFENARVLRGMRDEVNRLVNAETANLEKTVQASVKQLEHVKLLEATGSLARLSPPLREAAMLRLLYPEASLDELGRRLGISKSGANHRFRKIREMAERVRHDPEHRFGM